jgi:hypothetical protein
MRDTLPKTPKKKEYGVINLDDNTGNGTHWVAYKKNGKKVVYFDSFGNLKPPKEFVKYVKNSKIYFNYEQYQNFGTTNCGHLVLTFLYNKDL